jgi:hypothetical protein
MVGVLPGCTDKSGAKKTTATTAAKEHDHDEFGPHGGPLAEWGKEEYHAEFIVDAGKKQVTIFVLDGTAKAAPKVDADKITVELTIISVKPPVKVDLKHDKSASGDKLGIAFTGNNDLFEKPEGLRVNIRGKVDGKEGYSDDVTYKAPK